MSHPDAHKALDAAVKKIESDFGKGAIMRFGDAPPAPVEAIPTGSLPLDIALGVGGVPRGRIIEIYGPESSGKTTFCYEVMAQEQKKGGICAFIDSEHAMDPIYASQVGLNMNDLYVAQPDNGEQAIEIAETLIRSGSVSLIVIDSVAALIPKAELEGEMGDMQPGMQARLMSKALRKLVGVVKQTNCTVIFTNQIRMKIGVMFGSPETTTGGNALKFYASVRMDIRRIQTVKDGGEATANRVRVKVVKNKVAPPFREAEFEIVFGEGFDNYGSLIDLALDPQVAAIEKAGAFFTMPTGDKLQGRAKAVAWLKENPAVAEDLEVRIREALMPKRDLILVGAEEADEVDPALADVDEASEAAEDAA